MGCAIPIVFKACVFNLIRRQIISCLEDGHSFALKEYAVLFHIRWILMVFEFCSQDVFREQCGGSEMKLPNYVSSRWTLGQGAGELLFDPVTGDELVSISSQGIDLEAALQFARARGGPALRELSYTQRADLVEKIAEALA